MGILAGISHMLYIDPAATSVLLYSITAIVVACGATFIILWRKLRKKMKKTFHIDENAGKEVEEDLVILDEEPKAETAEQKAETKEEKPEVSETKEEEKAEAKTEEKKEKKEEKEEKTEEKAKKPAAEKKTTAEKKETKKVTVASKTKKSSK